MAVYRETDGSIVREYELDNSTFHRSDSRRQRIEVIPTKAFGDCLFLDGELQLSARDEYIYHEMLVHPAMNASYRHRRICILGGGDGCAAREILKWDGGGLEEVTIIDWDAEVINLFSHRYSYINNGSLQDPRVHIRTQDIQELFDEQFQFDVIVIDLTDPNPQEPSSQVFWQKLLQAARKWLSPRGSLVVNAGGLLPWDTEVQEWLYELLKNEFKFSQKFLIPYKTFVPSFAKEWCFFLLSPRQEITIRYSHNEDYINMVMFELACKWSIDYRDRLYPVHLNSPPPTRE